MQTLANKIQAFMYCAYNEPSDYIDAEWLTDKANIKIIITLLRLNIADDLRTLAHGIEDEQMEYGIDSNTEFDFALLLELKKILA
jgi:hypothetical protein